MWLNSHSHKSLNPWYGVYPLVLLPIAKYPNSLHSEVTKNSIASIILFSILKNYLIVIFIANFLMIIFIINPFNIKVPKTFNLVNNCISASLVYLGQLDLPQPMAILKMYTKDVIFTLLNYFLFNLQNVFK